MAKKNSSLDLSMKELMVYAKGNRDGVKGLIEKKKADSPTFAKEFEKESQRLDALVAQALSELESGDVARFDSYEDLLEDLKKGRSSK